MSKHFLWLFLLIMLAACEDAPPIPVTATPSQTPVLSSAEPLAASPLPPTQTAPPQATATAAPSATIADASPSTMLGASATPAPIQATAAYLYARSTATAANAQAVRPTEPPSAFIPLALPLEGWQEIQAMFTAADLQALLAGAEFADLAIVQEGRIFTLSWRSGNVPAELRFRQDALHGDLLLTPLSYWRAGQPAVLGSSDPLLALIRERWLGALIPPGQFTLQRLEVSDQGLQLVFKLPA